MGESEHELGAGTDPRFHPYLERIDDAWREWRSALDRKQPVWDDELDELWEIFEKAEKALNAALGRPSRH